MAALGWAIGIVINPAVVADGRMIGRRAGVKIGVAADTAGVAVEVPVVGAVRRTGRGAGEELHDPAMTPEAAGCAVVNDRGAAGIGAIEEVRLPAQGAIAGRC